MIFEKTNRKRFCAKIATGNYDIVVIGHSQFEKIPLSDARKAEFIRKQIDELEMQLESMDNSDSRLTVKQLESKKKQLKTKLSNLLDAPKRDDVVTLEELGADSLMVDEAHNFKNLMTATKMHNIAGISTTESQKASDLFMKCQYLDEITGARGVTFATGTPISNSMTELYTMQRYLQQYTLERNGLANFDSWAAHLWRNRHSHRTCAGGNRLPHKNTLCSFFQSAGTYGNVQRMRRHSNSRYAEAACPGNHRRQAHDCKAAAQ
mgnify:CR=1 FL=1